MKWNKLKTIMAVFLIAWSWTINSESAWAQAIQLTSSQHAAQGYEHILLGQNIYIKDSETKSIPLESVRRVKNLIIQAEGIRSDSQFEILVNGEVKGTVYTPGRDPSYIVTVEDVTRSIEIRHRSGGTAHIIEMYGTVSTRSTPISRHPGGGYVGDRDAVKNLAQDTLLQVDILKNFTTPDEFQEIIFPIKKNAGLVYVMSSAHGDLSKETLAKLVALMDQIDFARPLLNQLMQNEEAFDAVVDLLTIRETLADWLD